MHVCICGLTEEALQQQHRTAQPSLHKFRCPRLRNVRARMRAHVRAASLSVLFPAQIPPPPPPLRASATNDDDHTARTLLVKAARRRVHQHASRACPWRVCLSY